MEIERLRAKNEALIFINKELLKLKDEIKTEFDRYKSEQQLIDEDDDTLTTDDDRSSRPRKRVKFISKSRGKNKASSVEAQESDDEAARVCNFIYFIVIV